MRSLYRRYIISCLPVLILGSYSNEAIAQIVPDSSLGEEKSIVSPNVVKDSPAELIEGGAIRDSNLFHSFSEFNIGEGQQIYFASPEGIANIFSRVTGGNPSEILGKLGVNGTANLFLLNPNGIIFGQNSSLDLAGSFVATTADSIVFPNDFAFSASNPEAPPLLTINLPIGLQFGDKAESIVNRSQSLGKVEFGGEIFDATVGLRMTKEKTLALVGGEISIEGGFMTVPAGRVELGAVENNSFVSLQPIEKGWILDYGKVKNFQNIRLGENVLRANIDISDLGSIDPNSSGGSVQIQGKNVIFANGSQVIAANFVTVLGGSIIINASESVQFLGNGLPSSAYVSYVTVGDGKGGNIEINTKKLILQDGGGIFVDASRFILNDIVQPPTEGQAGEIIINASQSVELVGKATSISGSTSTKGDAGNIEITTDRLIIRDGATIEAKTIQKSDLFPESEGNGGSIIISSREIDIVNGGSIVVDSQAMGRGGDVNINTELLRLNQGKITANSFGNDGGNINLNAGNILELRQQSEISTDAGETIGGGSGGNINIDARFILAIPTENSDISANAFEGNGGNITIDTESLFGIVYRDAETPASDITAFSRNKFALNGTVIINSPDVDPSEDLNKVSVKMIMPRLLQGCQTGGNLDSRFINIGRGGIPIDVEESLSSQELVEDLRLPKYWSQSLSGDRLEIVEAKEIQRDNLGKIVLVGELNSYCHGDDRI
jgi:filamentous hemagglutinin family protein